MNPSEMDPIFMQFYNKMHPSTNFIIHRLHSLDVNYTMSCLFFDIRAHIKYNLAQNCLLRIEHTKEKEVGRKKIKINCWRTHFNTDPFTHTHLLTTNKTNKIASKKNR